MKELQEAYLEIYDEFVPLTPEKEKRVQDRFGELARGVQVSVANVKNLRKKPFQRFRPKVKQQIASNIQSAKKNQRLAQNASDSLIRTSVDREANTRFKINQLKNKLGDAEGRNNIRKFNREEIEYILDTLVSEGFVTEYEEAVSILEFMSDSWIENILMEAPWDIVHHGSNIEGTRVGPSEPKVVKTYKNRTRAKNQAEKMNQDYGATAYSVRRTQES